MRRRMRDEGRGGGPDVRRGLHAAHPSVRGEPHRPHAHRELHLDERYGYDFIAHPPRGHGHSDLPVAPVRKVLSHLPAAGAARSRFYKDLGARGEAALCRRCRHAFSSRMHVEDLIRVERRARLSLRDRRERGGALPMDLSSLPPRASSARAGRPVAAAGRTGSDPGRDARLRQSRKRTGPARGRGRAKLPPVNQPSRGKSIRKLRGNRSIASVLASLTRETSGSIPESSPTGWSRRTAASAASSAAYSSRSRTTRSSASSPGTSSLSTRESSARRGSSATSRAPTPIGCSRPSSGMTLPPGGFRLTSLRASHRAGRR